MCPESGHRFVIRRVSACQRPRRVRPGGCVALLPRLLTCVHAPRALLAAAARAFRTCCSRRTRWLQSERLSAARALRLTRVTARWEPGCGPACNSRASWCLGTPLGSCTTRTRASCAFQTAAAPRSARSWGAPVSTQRRASRRARAQCSGGGQGADLQQKVLRGHALRLRGGHDDAVVLPRVAPASVSAGGRARRRVPRAPCAARPARSRQPTAGKTWRRWSCKRCKSLQQQQRKRGRSQACARAGGGGARAHRAP